MIIALAVTGLGCRMGNERPDILVPSEVSCPTCSIVIDSVVTLEGAYLGLGSAIIARDPEGFFYLVDGGDRLLKAYAPDGRFVRQIGRLGAGPGEYERIRRIFVGSDSSIRVLDGMLGRLSTFSRNGDFLGSIRVPIVGNPHGPAVLLEGDVLVATGTPDGGKDAQYSLAAFDLKGDTVQSVNEVVPSKPGNWWLYERLLWARPNGELLVAQVFTFAVDVYRSDLTGKSSFRRVGDLIPSQPPEAAPSDGLFDTPATPQLRMLWEDAQGLVWLGTVVASPLWKPGPSPEQGRRMNQQTLLTLAERPRFDIVIEVLDMEKQRVLARSHLNGPAGTPFGGGYLAKSLQSSKGELGVRISRVSLQPNP